MKTVELIAPCHFGLEAVLKREILDLGYEIVKVEDGRITFSYRFRWDCPCEYIFKNSRKNLIKNRFF